MKSNEGILMTEGSISRQMIAFAVPIFLGQLFQQLYNTVDTLIVGNYLGSEALAAVSSSGNLIQLLVGFFNGMSMGASIVISQCFGSGDHKRVEQTVHTATALGLIISVVLAILGIWASPIILRWMGTPEEVLPLSNEYFVVYFMGIGGMILYNVFSSIMRAVGDSRHPLYFLIISSVVNVVLDIVFISVFHWGVAGAAIATVISQFLSTILSLNTLMRLDGPHKIRLRAIRFHKGALNQIIRYGIPSGIQNSIISLANVVVQANINAFGAMAMAGCGAYSKLEGFAFLPIMSFNLAISTFVGQNLGAGKKDRVLKGARFGIWCGVLLAELVGIVFYFYADFFVGLFDSNPDVIAYGAARARCNAPFYFLLAYSHAISAVCRGGGKPAVPMYVMMICWCAIRVSFLYMTAGFHNILFVYWVYPLTWSLSSVYFAWYYHKKTWLNSAIPFAKAQNPAPAKQADAEENASNACCKAGCVCGCSED